MLNMEQISHEVLLYIVYPMQFSVLDGQRLPF